ncbi:sigma-70 family RNA polymerase sigma factor [Conexibacter sp. JD483]|uniref:RNA polymerase sigma factor n=1 Tax=unclassified Conexibacter TaxID=2627773 RepID=UPI00271FC89A|nr:MULTISPECIES: sigma-70 family RNA polymerase sigma factor [unclassified Conexibacter]MDO8189585.1 sigma-70 family RNA polymerase sigma factor [Conexibacter sp. CPCC 205706]MDO8202129.1 sigma-70 family RNA polymerase sigma factor [Conexibacter sp. CPCC 205762]MDR9373088.1 sigma-70 family RNA polymerase sigma factor [Conexibacter sp. JD483]
MAEDTQRLVRLAQRGDLDAFERLVAEYRRPVHRVATRLVGADDAEDVTQDTFLRAFHSLAGFRGDASFRTWLLRIAYNTALNTLARRRTVPYAEPPEPRGDAPGIPRTPAQQLESSERAERLLHKISLLRADYRAVIVMRDLEELSYEEIAGILDRPVGTVKTRLHRARSLMIEMLRSNTYDWELPS